MIIKRVTSQLQHHVTKHKKKGKLWNTKNRAYLRYQALTFWKFGTHKACNGQRAFNKLG